MVLKIARCARRASGARRRDSEICTCTATSTYALLGTTALLQPGHLMNAQLGLTLNSEAGTGTWLTALTALGTITVQEAHQIQEQILVQLGPGVLLDRPILNFVSQVSSVSRNGMEIITILTSRFAHLASTARREQLILYHAKARKSATRVQSTQLFHPFLLIPAPKACTTHLPNATSAKLVTYAWEEHQPSTL